MTTAQTEARAVVALAEEMRSGLTGVTPGPWTLIPAIPYDGDDDGLEGAFVEPAGIEGSDGNPVCIFGSALGSGSLFENERDHEHINRCHPDNIRALLDDRDAIAGQNAELRAEIAALKKQVEELTAERDALEVKAVSLLWAVPGETLCGEVQSLHKRALELQSAEAEAAALRKALEFYADVSKYPAPLTGGMGDLWADCGQIARAALEAAGGRG